MYPTLEEIKALAASGQYKRIPVCQEMMADRFTTIEVMRTLQAASHHCFMLESAENGQPWSRYSFLGYDPSMEITCINGKVTITTGTEEEAKTVETYQVDHPGEIFRKIIADHKSPKLDTMPPFTGGLVGYFSYDYIMELKGSIYYIFYFYCSHC